MTDLSPLATDDGYFTIAALDHRDALVMEFEAASDQQGTEAIVAFKQQLLQAIGDRPSAVMLEPEFSLPTLRSFVAEGVGVTCALEAQGYFSDPRAGNRLMDGWSPARVRSVGADAAKLLLLYRHDLGTFTDAQETLVRDVVSVAAAAKVPILVEPLPIDLTDDADRAEVVIEAARRLSPMGPMLLKLPFPGTGHCDQLDKAAGSNPWALLSWGVTFDEYHRQLEEAVSAGCSGFTAGRALWREGLASHGREQFFATTLLERFDQLAELTQAGRPWFDRS